jgi:Membrane protein involved in the export of O-antigen and teichoic acid
MDLGRRLRTLVARSPVLVDAGTLLSGTVLAQVVVLVTTPLVSRLYSPSETGLFAAFMTLPQTIAVVAGLRYDMAVVLPERDADARRLVRLVMAVAALVSVLTSAVTWMAAPTIAGWMGHPELEGWLVWSGAVVMATVLVNVMGYWFTRTRSYRIISVNRVQQATSVEGVKVLSGWAGYGGMGGQMLGQVLGQGLAAVTLLFRGRNAWAGSTEGPPVPAGSCTATDACPCSMPPTPWWTPSGPMASCCSSATSTPLIPRGSSPRRGCSCRRPSH